MTLSTKSVLLEEGGTNPSLAIKRLNTNSMEAAEVVNAGKGAPIISSVPPIDEGATAFYNGFPIYCINGSWKYFSNNAEV